jgi:hypothetical protein
VTPIADMIVAIHQSLARAELDHAFGGALALAWCTQAPRGTSDIDLNVFTGVAGIPAVLEALPAPVTWSASDRALLERDGQARLHWDTTPVDLFLNTTDFHEAVGGRAVFHEFAGVLVPFLSCADLAVFKAFFNRTKDWADLEEMIAAGMVDTERAIGALARHLGSDDERVSRLVDLAR